MSQTPGLAQPICARSNDAVVLWVQSDGTCPDPGPLSPDLPQPRECSERRPVHKGSVVAQPCVGGGPPFASAFPLYMWSAVFDERCVRGRCADCGASGPPPVAPNAVQGLQAPFSTRFPDCKGLRRLRPRPFVKRVL